MNIKPDGDANSDADVVDVDVDVDVGNDDGQEGRPESRRMTSRGRAVTPQRV